MNLKNTPDKIILMGLDHLVASERKITNEILWHIVEVDLRKLYLEIAENGICYSSTIEYLIKHCKYSEPAAYRRLNAARLLIQVPEVSSALQEGSLNLTQLNQVQAHIKKEKKSGNKKTSVREVLQVIENKSNFETQKILAVEFDQPVLTFEKVSPQKDGSMQVLMSFTKEQYENIKKAKELNSHICPDQSLSSLFNHLVEADIKKHEGKTHRGEKQEGKKNRDKKHEGKKHAGEKQEAESLKSKQTINPTQSAAATEKPREMNFPRTRRRIPIKVLRVLKERSQGQCEYEKDGARCQSRYKVQTDHVKPWALGGEDSIENYRVLCQAHNLSEARRWGLSGPWNPEL